MGTSGNELGLALGLGFWVVKNRVLMASVERALLGLRGSFWRSDILGFTTESDPEHRNESGFKLQLKIARSIQQLSTGRGEN